MTPEFVAARRELAWKSAGVFGLAGCPMIVLTTVQPGFPSYSLGLLALGLGAVAVVALGSPLCAWSVRWAASPQSSLVLTNAPPPTTWQRSDGTFGGIGLDVPGRVCGLLGAVWRWLCPSQLALCEGASR